MTEPTPDAPPAQIDVWAMTPAEATARLNEIAAARSPPPPPIAPANAQDARRRLDVLIADRDFGARLLDGNVDAKAEWDRLQQLAAENIDPVNPPPSDQIFHTTMNGELPPGAVASFVAFARNDLGFSDQAITEMVTGKKMSAELVARARGWRAMAMRQPEFAKLVNEGNPHAHARLLEANAILAAGIEDAA
jgi:hypothetical protein